MFQKWDKYSRLGLDIAATATAFGFSAAKAGTRLGFSITRGIVSTTAGLTGSALDHAFFGGSIGAGPIVGGAVSSAISAIESVALAPILLGETITSTSLVAAHSSLSVLQTVFPGSDEASFSLASFVALVQREWQNPVESSGLPEERYGVGSIMKGLVAWATLQGMTSRWQEEGWLKSLREIQEHQELPNSPTVHRSTPQVNVTANVTYPSHGSQIMTADIGDPASSESIQDSSAVPACSSALNSPSELKICLRRFSKLVLAGYGGASLLFFGIPTAPSLTRGDSRREAANLTDAIDASEAEAATTSVQRQADASMTPSDPRIPSYSWWDVLMGRHDHDIFLQYANSQPSSPAEGVQMQSAYLSSPPSTVMRSTDDLMPRFWVLTDHSRHEVVLVIRGTMSLNELAVDLTCDPADFEVHVSHSSSFTTRSIAEENTDVLDDELESIPGTFPMDLSTPSPNSQSKRRKRRKRHRHPSTSATCSTGSADPEVYQVHGGMLKMARAMGERGKPVHIAVRDALRKNRGYNLVICGHSLGAGVAALLALLWADPSTCCTHRSSGLPRNRHVSAYCYAPPCLVSSSLSHLAASSGLITSFVYSHDIVSRLSLGSVRDLTRSALWLCEAERQGGSDGYGGVTGKALKSRTGYVNPDDEHWFLSIRKTLEANMHMANLFPPGRVLWAIRDGDLHPSHRLRHNETSKEQQKIRLFEVLDVEKVFGQIVFARDMLSSHMPHQYDRVLHELL